MADLDGTQVVATVAILGWLGTVVFAVLKGRDLVAKMALEAVGSIEGRSVVLGIVSDKQSRIEEKLDALTHSVNGMTTELRTQMHQMSNEVRDLTVRIAIIEDRRGIVREER